MPQMFSDELPTVTITPDGPKWNAPTVSPDNAAEWATLVTTIAGAARASGVSYLKLPGLEMTLKPTMAPVAPTTIENPEEEDPDAHMFDASNVKPMSLRDIARGRDS